MRDPIGLAIDEEEEAENKLEDDGVDIELDEEDDDDEDDENGDDDEEEDEDDGA
jgi:hypothetical protein